MIKIESFIFNNKITFLLKIPITFSKDFEYFHIYSMPIQKQSVVKVVIPKNKFLVKNELHFSYRANECQEIYGKFFFCDKMDLQEITPNSPCAVQLLGGQDQPTCQQIEVKISKSIFNQLDSSDTFAVVLPDEKTLHLECPTQEEFVKQLLWWLLFGDRLNWYYSRQLLSNETMRHWPEH